MIEKLTGSKMESNEEEEVWTSPNRLETGDRLAMDSGRSYPNLLLRLLLSSETDEIVWLSLVHTIGLIFPYIFCRIFMKLIFFSKVEKVMVR